jgi:multicomponent Na+:H+ antiporter subunit B
MKSLEPGMTLIVKTITRLTVGLILLYGVYIVLHGHLTPGGGFAGGVIIALSFIHLMLAFGREVALKKISEARASVIENLGAVMFLSIKAGPFIYLAPESYRCAISQYRLRWEQAYSQYLQH